MLGSTPATHVARLKRSRIELLFGLWTSPIHQPHCMKEQVQADTPGPAKLEKSTGTTFELTMNSRLNVTVLPLNVLVGPLDVLMASRAAKIMSLMNDERPPLNPVKPPNWSR